MRRERAGNKGGRLYLLDRLRAWRNRQLIPARDAVLFVDQLYEGGTAEAQRVGFRVEGVRTIVAECQVCGGVRRWKHRPGRPALRVAHARGCTAASAEAIFEGAF